MNNTIRELREKKGYSIKTFAKLCGVSPSYIYQLEKGEKNPSLKTLRKITYVLGVELTDLYLPVPKIQLKMNETGPTEETLQLAGITIRHLKALAATNPEFDDITNSFIEKVLARIEGERYKFMD